MLCEVSRCSWRNATLADLELGQQAHHDVDQDGSSLDQPSVVDRFALGKIDHSPIVQAHEEGLEACLVELCHELQERTDGARFDGVDRVSRHTLELQTVSEVEDVEEERKDRLDQAWQSGAVRVTEHEAQQVEEAR